jgi:hypothetical protein
VLILGLDQYLQSRHCGGRGDLDAVHMPGQRTRRAWSQANSLNPSRRAGIDSISYLCRPGVPRWPWRQSLQGGLILRDTQLRLLNGARQRHPLPGSRLSGSSVEQQEQMVKGPCQAEPRGRRRRMRTSASAAFTPTRGCQDPALRIFVDRLVPPRFRKHDSDDGGDNGIGAGDGGDGDDGVGGRDRDSQ